MLKSLLSITLIWLFLGCSQNVARFSTATTTSLPITVKAKDCRTQILFWVLGDKQNRISSAVEKALEAAAKLGHPVDSLENVDVSHSYWSVWLFGQDCYTASGEIPINS